MKRDVPQSLERRPVRLPRARREVALRRAAASAARRYRRMPHVLAVAAGWKYRSGHPSDELAVQFFVDRKLKRPREPVPSYVYARRSDGRLDRSRCFITDVVEVGRFEFACGAGSRVEATGQSGTITLIFRNRAEPFAAWFLLTCSHVAGDLLQSPPVDDELDSPACAAADPFARVVKNAVAREGVVQYDIALARLGAEAIAKIGARALERIDGRVDGDDRRLRSFVPSSEIGPSMEVEWMGAESGPTSARVTTFAFSAEVVLNGRALTVPHLYTLDSPAQVGDSGGLVYTDDRAIGIVVARSPGGFCWFQPLEAAIRYLERRAPAAPLRCFPR